MLRQKLQCPVAIAAKRLRGVDLLREAGCDIVVADDGLQHYLMGAILRSLWLMLPEVWAMGFTPRRTVAGASRPAK